MPGWSLHDELRLLVGAGLTPYRALRTATLNPSRSIKQLRDGGSVAPGTRADLVLLDRNPLEDVANARAIAGVVVAGRWFSRTEIDRRLSEAASLLSRPPIH